ncbi:IscS subfamily cysteine desulfurase [Halobacillus seohaensis]|uniref:IscS subfamily cysteine desulfurase n=1 Tax=Halobacillus seohaensis TaxID=447421 RepID=A0ABW2EMJ4_9BACI
MNYFDYAATCPISETALETYIKASREYFGNTQSVHDIGSKADLLVEHCRQTLANLLQVEREGITFTSGGTESNMLALNALASAKNGNHIIISTGEHSSVHNTISKLSEEKGYEVSEVSLTNEGVVNTEELKRVIRKDTVLVSVQHVNSDIGTVQPIEKIHELCQANGIWLHSDCVQSFGKIDLSKVTSLVDSFSLSSHKIYGPKGVGALYIRPTLSFVPFFEGVSHENGVRPGTLNTPGIAAFTTAAENNLTNLEVRQQHIKTLKKEFLASLEDVTDFVNLIGFSADSSIPILGLCMREIDGQHMMLEGNRRGYSFSTGSACKVRGGGLSKTLLSMGISEEEARTFIRISFGFDQNLEDVRGLAASMKKVMKERNFIG